MELWNVYDQYRHLTDRIHKRGEEMKAGDYHLVVHVWIINDDGQFLIQKRQPWKIGFPDMWDCSAAGSAVMGDNSEQAAIREAKEELGIDLDIEKGERLFTVKFSQGFDDIWLVRQNVALEDLHLQEEEVADAKWANEEEIREMAETGEFIPFNYFDLIFEMANSSIALKKASVDDADELLALQKEVFMPLYKKYNDHETSPVTQTMERFSARFERGDFFKILFEGVLAGTVHVYEKSPGLMRLHIINILEEYHNNGIAQEVMKMLELMYPEADAWELDTILTEERNCYLYEKMGYKRTGEVKEINKDLTLIRYRKDSNLSKIESL
ncbi:bifunctional NUDIX hydrolase family protein/GNAT family N-acetyltransferase [Mesobacillus selenatarsenatis]|uniref:Putative nudix hydrolase YfcD n=1 Tax=Mesobacillus selenatarsenatis (strain DSM 18680 / JCM 14380 / FERM P-15431 / SF-1) TaxID=1321606 RepID=A0A0A8XAA6_MESS1|nr:bifunctional NUDIX hydrolase family protein/GNAT family N-acetyltransferase [Mesobacillus selenatarsenatis]GAM15932.1 putative nudix hydrolase YfcD [Mesobacillus selenatarsenatis SF-1]